MSLLSRLEELCLGVDAHSFQLTGEQTELMITAMAKETKLETLVMYDIYNELRPVLLGTAISICYQCELGIWC